ncbi:MAG: DALR anticodon-binding domain-containing protein, partial [Leptotrichiaceae bacterium]
VADYLFETAKLFNTFYNSITIIKEENDDIRNARLALCEKTASVLKEGLSLLGIKTVDRM